MLSVEYLATTTVTLEGDGRVVVLRAETIGSGFVICWSCIPLDPLLGVLVLLLLLRGLGRCGRLLGVGGLLDLPLLLGGGSLLNKWTKVRNMKILDREICARLRRKKAAVRELFGHLS